MRIWTFDELQLESALAAHAALTDQDCADAVRDFLNSQNARNEKLFTDMKLRTNVPLSPADIKEPTHGNPS